MSQENSKFFAGKSCMLPVFKRYISSLFWVVLNIFPKDLNIEH